MSTPLTPDGGVDDPDPHVSAEKIAELRTRYDLGDKTLTFEDGMAAAYAMAERLPDELDHVAAGDGDDYERNLDELVDLTSFAAWVHGGYRIEFHGLTRLEVPPEVRAEPPLPEAGEPPPGAA